MGVGHPSGERHLAALQHPQRLRLRAVVALGGSKLQRDDLINQRVPDAIDGAHPAGAEPLLDEVAFREERPRAQRQARLDLRHVTPKALPQ
jgi:hypothetical protein